MRKDTRDGDSDQESNFWVLRKTVMPAILSENFFMTNRKESAILLSEEGRDRIAISVFIVASFFIGFGTIHSSDWVDVAMIYIGGQAVVDAVAKLRR
jgi:hypothetical protein